MKDFKSLKFQKVIVVILLIIFGFCCSILYNNITKKIVEKTHAKNVILDDENFQMEMGELKDFLDKINSIIITKNNSQRLLLISDEEFTQIINEMKYIFCDVREMPAIGVSLDESTRLEMINGMWLELCFRDIEYHNDMPFESWLINVVPDYTGFNIIRKYNDKFEGRCFYVDLMNGKSLEGLYKILLES